MRWMLAVVFGLAPALASATGPESIVEITGNGRLTAGIDATGSLAQLRWPTLGYWEHLRWNSAAGAATGGAGWQISEGPNFNSFTEAEWDISHVRNEDGSLTTTYGARRDDRRAVQHVAVLRERDVVVVRLELEGFQGPVKVRWYQHLAPSTHLVTGLVDSYDRFSQTTGFVTAFDPIDGMMLSFRPKTPGRDDWARAHRLADSVRSSTAWSSFGEGAYWGTFSPSGVRTGICMPLGALPPEVGYPERDGVLPAVVGRGYAMLEPVVETTSEGRQQVRICLAVASSEQDLQASRTKLLDAGLPSHSSTASLPTATSEEQAGPALLACVDLRTGAIVCAPLSYPARAHATVFNTAWATAALDRLGFGGHAQRALKLHRATVRTAYGVDGLPGSLPASVHSTGRSASFLDGANPASTAWLMAALWRHISGLESTVAATQLAEWGEVLGLCGDYLARAPVVGAVLSGTMKPTAASLADLQTHYLGLLSARLLLERRGESEPTHWQQRREETYARIRFRQLDGGEEGGSPWLDAWVRHLPETARGEEEAWAILQRPTASPVLLPAASRGIADGVPVSLRAALTVLGVEYEE